ncbi:hypothetical protein K2Q02_02995 [Patescibacteria group bacterium]|nr:hypothetical protein [Patescibacteria group bacterium]
MLRKLRTLFWLGILMLILPFIGIPNTIKMIIALSIGLGLIILAVGMRKEYRTLRMKLKEYGQ